VEEEGNGDGDSIEDGEGEDIAVQGDTGGFPDARYEDVRSFETVELSPRELAKAQDEAWVSMYKFR
jgi:hypothetical protein